MTSKEKFDAITSDPLDPWVKGAAMLYTREFFESAKAHLNPGGVVTLFVQLYESNTAAVKSEIGTFFEAFPNGVIWGNTNNGAGLRPRAARARSSRPGSTSTRFRRSCSGPSTRRSCSRCARSASTPRSNVLELRGPRPGPEGVAEGRDRSTATGTCVCSISPGSASICIRAARSTPEILALPEISRRPVRRPAADDQRAARGNPARTRFSRITNDGSWFHVPGSRFDVWSSRSRVRRA